MNDMIYTDKKHNNNKSHDDHLHNNINKCDANIALIGMPSCGKTTIGRILSEKLGKNLIDIDEEIVKEINMPIADYFRANGEKAFRDIETKVTKRISNIQNTIISCGGGIIKNKENIDHLKNNSIIIFIDRDVDKLFVSSDRPLSSIMGTLEKLYNERIDLYLKYSDIQLTNNSLLEEVVDQIIQVHANYVEN
ncbi:shikimate kinase [Fusobacterium sp. PH5-44]|uniref:shikimate kinase n=1 Tax=unclassified Fusobacterium TaxID=2648384 RepID=UPI003D2008CB